MTRDWWAHLPCVGYVAVRNAIPILPAVICKTPDGVREALLQMWKATHSEKRAMFQIVRCPTYMAIAAATSMPVLVDKAAGQDIVRALVQFPGFGETNLSAVETGIPNLLRLAVPASSRKVLRDEISELARVLGVLTRPPEPAPADPKRQSRR